MTRTLLTAAQVALLLGRKAGWFLAHRAALEARGFPGPVDGCGLRWDPRAIEAWLDARLPRAATADGQAEATLLARAAALAESPGARAG